MNTVVTAKRGFQQTAGALLAVSLLMAAGTGSGQDAADGFNPNADHTVRAIAIQADGNVLLGGDFTTLGAGAQSYMGRVRANGNLDTAFNPTVAGVVPASVYAIALQGDGKILIGGAFTTINGASHPHIARLNPDGALDAAYTPNANALVRALVLQSDGKLLVGGDFVNLGGQVRNFIGRLNADGSLDTAFNPTTDGAVHAIALQPDGKIIVGGSFILIGGQTRNRLARLNADGSLDPTFVMTNGVNEAVWSLAIQADGKIVVGGAFNAVNSLPYQGIARLNADGSLDTAFNPIADGNVYALAVQADGKILAGGDFANLGGAGRIRIGRLNPNGTLDTTFESPGGALGKVYALAVQTDNSVLAGGAFLTLGGVNRNCIGRLYPDGSLDNNFLDAVANPALGASDEVYSLAQQTDGQLIVGGIFSKLSGANRNQIGRFTVDGTLDAAFNPNADGSVLAIVIQSDGKILIGGFFGHLDETDCQSIARLDSAGNPEAGFNPQLSGGGVYCIAPQPDGKIIVAGTFTKIGATACKRIGRLNSDGTLDTAFTVPSGADDSIYSVLLQPDGKILVAGRFTHLGGVARNHIGRLNSDGSLDTAFDPSANNGSVYALALQTDGKILLGGNFTTIGIGATDCKRIGRLNSDGTLDTSFVVPGGAESLVQSIALQADGKILVCGWFTQIGGLDRLCLARLNTNGTVDTDYAPQNGNDWAVNGLVLQPDGKVIAGGLFDQLTGYKRNYIGRLSAVTAAGQNLAMDLLFTAIVWTRTGSSPELDTVTFEQSLDGTTWSTLGAGSRITNGWQITGLTLPRKTNLYLRARGFYRCGNYNNSVSICESVRLFYLLNRIDGDFDGDRLADPFTVDSAGNWYIWFSSGSYQRSGPFAWGQAGWKPVAGDFDGDRLADPAMADAAGNWYFCFSSGAYLRDGPYALGQAGWTPVAGDFDGDGLADPAMADAAGNWYFCFSSGAYLRDGPYALGQAGWTPVAGDFDGDGLADPAMADAVGNWYFCFSSGAYLRDGPYALGQAGWRPIAGDFDGDGLADPTMVDSAVNWYFCFSSGAYLRDGPYVLPLP